VPTGSAPVNQFPKQQAESGEIGRSQAPFDEFVLSHTTQAYDRGGWEQHHYNVTAYGKISEAFANRHQPGQVIVITGELDLQLQDTLIGTLPHVSIVANRIITVDGPLNRAASAGAPETDVELQHSATTCTRHNISPLMSVRRAHASRGLPPSNWRSSSAAATTKNLNPRRINRKPHHQDHSFSARRNVGKKQPRRRPSQTQRRTPASVIRGRTRSGQEGARTTPRRQPADHSRPAVVWLRSG
jgi:hypothetical protein